MTRAIFALIVALALATPASAELDGPMILVDRTQPSTSTVNGVQVTTYPVVPGVHLICSTAFYTAHADVLKGYRDMVQTNLEAVYAGDDPAHPTQTVALTFPDQATADAVKAQLLPSG